MVKLRYYIYGEYKKTLRLSDKKFTTILLNKSLEFSHSNCRGDWYKDSGLGSYLRVKITNKEAINNLHFSIIVLKKQIAMWKKSIAKKEKILKNLKGGDING